MNTKKVFPIFIIILLLTISCGCNNNASGQNASDNGNIISSDQKTNAETSPKETIEYNFPDHYKKSKENIEFDINNVDDGSIKTLNYAKAYELEYDHEKIKEILLNNNITETYQEEITDNNGKKVKCEYLTGSRGELLNITGSLIYRTEFSNYIDNSFRLMDLPNFEKYPTDQDLPFKSREEALKDILHIFEELGFNMNNDIISTCYALDYEQLKNEEYAEDMDGSIDKSVFKDVWTKDDSCYYFCIRQKIQGIPEYHPYSNIFKSSGNENAPIQVIYSKYGIQKIEIDKVFEFQTENKALTLKPFETVAETVENKFTQIITSANYKVSSAKLYFMTEFEKDLTWKLTPIWILGVEETIEEEGVHNKLEIFINAETGEELPMEDKY